MSPVVWRGSHVFIRYFASCWVEVGVELALHRQPSFGRGRGNQLEDHSVADKRLAAPVLADPGEETMLDLVPFARAWRQVADRDGESCLIGQLLQFPLPQAHPRAIAAPSIRTDEHLPYCALYLR